MALQFENNVPIKQIPQGLANEEYGSLGYSEGTIQSLVHLNGTEDPDTWAELADLKREHDTPVKITGGLTNVYFSGDFEGTLVTYRQDDTPKVELSMDSKGRIECPAAIPLAHFVETASMTYERPVGNLAGIPGSLGAAVVGNSGRTVTRHNIGDLVSTVFAYDLEDGGREIEFNMDTFQQTAGRAFFGQRSSYLQEQNQTGTRYVVSRVVMNLGDEPHPQAQPLYRQRIEERSIKNQEGRHTTGSIFVNGIVPNHVHQGSQRRYLVRDCIKEAKIVHEGEQMPLIDLEIGGISLTPDHAFMRFQDGRAIADKDVATFLHTIVSAIYDQYNFLPELEIDVIGRCGSVILGDYLASHGLTLPNA